MSLTTGDGFIFESRGETSGDKVSKVYRWIVLALDGSEAIGLLNSEMNSITS